MPRIIPHGVRFQPGVSGNPEGGRRHNKTIKALKTLTTLQVQEIGSIILNKNLNALQEIIKNPESSVFQVWTASIAAKAIQKGDSAAWEAILCRIVGRVPNRIEATGKDGAPLANGPQVIVALPSNGFEAKDESKPS